MSGGEAFDRLAAALAEIRPRFGAGAFADRRRVIGLLADKAPDAKREIRVVGTAIDEGIPASLARTERHLVGVEMDRLANGLEASTGLRPDIARQVVRAFAFAMDLGPLPSVYEAGGAMPPPVVPPPASAAPPPPPPAGSWTGMTAPVQPPPHAVSNPISQFPPISQPTQPHGTAPMGFVGAQPKKPNMAGRIALGVGGLVVLALGVSQMIGGGTEPRPANNMIATPAQTGFANELLDQGIAAQSELNENLGAPTPMSIAVGERISTVELQQMIENDPQLVLVDVLAQPHEQTIHGAFWLPSGGSAGSFSDSYQSDFAAGLGQVTGGVQSRPLVFFCASANCWESYNATLRANAAGYTRLFWYRGGLAAWAEARLPMAPLPTQGAAGQTPSDPQQPADPAQQPEQPADPNAATAPAGDKVPVQ